MLYRKVEVQRSRLAAFEQAVHFLAPVSLGPRRTSSPHEFYRYPARFHPAFARAAIEFFSDPGDLILDPFVGGGTTAVEAMLAGRRSVVADLNFLATFVTRVKTRPLSSAQRNTVLAWIEDSGRDLRLNRPRPPLMREWDMKGYLLHLRTAHTWRLAKLIALGLAAVPTQDRDVQRFCRCIILRTAQWALDMRSHIPTVQEFRDVFVDQGRAMVEAIESFKASLPKPIQKTVVVDSGLPGLSLRPQMAKAGIPRLVVTSPPYPGVYVNYHRWKLLGRKEVPAPYWIANRQDGNGLSYYTMSARAEPTLRTYFEKLEAAYLDLSQILGPETVVVQLVGFNEAANQLPRFLKSMSRAGFAEFKLRDLASHKDGRLWRVVPGRRWWTQAQSKRSIAPHTAQEVVLFHRLRAGRLKDRPDSASQ